jgi:hypothetical protein
MTVDSSSKRYLVLTFVVTLALLFSASAGFGGPQAQGKGNTTATFFVA